MRLSVGLVCATFAIALCVPLAAIMADDFVNPPGFENGNDLFRHCKASNTGDALCIGYIQGVVDQWEIVRAIGKHPQCVPTGTENSQVRDAVVNYLTAHPEYRGTSAAGLVTGAIVGTWHCY